MSVRREPWIVASMSGRLLCPLCGDVIGVYEPLLVVRQGLRGWSVLLPPRADWFVQRSCCSAGGRSFPHDNRWRRPMARGNAACSVDAERGLRWSRWIFIGGIL
jgi:hypothetical protein